MSQNTIGSIDAGEVDAEIAERAARRIRDYLERHPDEDLIEALGEVGDQDALVIPRPTAIMFAQILICSHKVAASRSFRRKWNSARSRRRSS